MIKLTPTITSSSQTINGFTYTMSADSILSGNTYLPYKSLSTYTGSGQWYSDNVAFPHYIEIDMGRHILLSQLSFTPADDVVDVLVKNFKINVSTDNINFSTVYSGTNVVTTPGKETLINCTFTQVACRYIKLIIVNGYNSRSYQWTSVKSLDVYGSFCKLFIQDNNQIKSTDGIGVTCYNLPYTEDGFKNYGMDDLTKINKNTSNLLIDQKYKISMYKP